MFLAIQGTNVQSLIQPKFCQKSSIFFRKKFSKKNLRITMYLRQKWFKPKHHPSKAEAKVGQKFFQGIFFVQNSYDIQ